MKRLFETGKGKNESWKLPTDNEGFKFEGEKSEVEIDGVDVMDVIDKISEHYAINKEDAGAFIREITESDVDEDDEPSIDDLIVRHFTKELEGTDKSVFDMFEYSIEDVEYRDTTMGDNVFYMKGCEFPKSFDANARNILATKYFRKAGVPDEYGYEHSIKQIVHRMVHFWQRYLLKDGLLNENNKDIFYDEVAYMMLDQRFAPNSPSWFNSGLYVYGNSKTGNEMYKYDETIGEVVEVVDEYEYSQTSACYISSILDKLIGSHSISEQYITETKLFSKGSGNGSAVETIRGKGEKLSGGGVSSGLLSFLAGWDKNAGTIRSGGSTRRSAKLYTLDYRHPDIFEYIGWKVKEEDKVRVLIKAGYDSSFDGEAYGSVEAQNVNNSVKFDDEFMKLVENLDKNPEATIWLRGVVDSNVDREVKVKDLWDAFNLASATVGDPAPQYIDTMNAWHTCPAGEDGKVGERHNNINATNP